MAELFSLRCLPFDDSSDLGPFDSLTVPQRCPDLELTSSNSLDATELFLPLRFDSSGEASSPSFSSPASDASSSLDELTSSLPIAFAQPERLQQSEPAAAPLPLGLNGLNLKLDFRSVASSWHMMGGANPFHLRGPALATATCLIPSISDLEASLAAPPLPATGASPAGSTAGLPGPCAATTSADAANQASKEAGRQRDRRANRNRTDRKVVYPPRKVSSDKRPRIKGRFVSRAEFHQVAAAHSSHARTVPALVRA
ncbi:hypothetical protein ACK3TF_001731 [Chlorella vulgaris]